MTEEKKCENCKHYDTQEKCCLCRNKYWYEPNDEIKIEELEEELGQSKEIIREYKTTLETLVIHKKLNKDKYGFLVEKAEAFLKEVDG